VERRDLREAAEREIYEAMGTGILGVNRWVRAAIRPGPGLPDPAFSTCAWETACDPVATILGESKLQ
jgi:hypothetical protein